MLNITACAFLFCQDKISLSSLKYEFTLVKKPQQRLALPDHILKEFTGSYTVKNRQLLWL